MFGLVKQVLIALLSISYSLNTTCISLNDEPCVAKLSLIDLNPNEFYNYLFMVSLDRCN